MPNTQHPCSGTSLASVQQAATALGRGPDWGGGMAAGAVAVGELIGERYRLLHEIGRGGMAVVYRAHDAQLARDVALKLVEPELSVDRDFSDALLHEARAVAGLPSPHVVTVFDAGEHHARPYIVMELVEGGDLRALLRREGRLRPAEAARIGLGIARGLAATHARGLVHCDVKPLNVLLTPEGEPKLIDFGIARAAALTRALDREAIVGSAPYLSPEQVRGERIDARTDVYALGIVLYEMLAGRPPFVGATLAEVAAQRLHRRPDPLGEVAPGTPPALAAVAERALALDPAARFGDAGEMAAALAGWERASVGAWERERHSASPHKAETEVVARPRRTPPVSPNRFRRVPPTLSRSHALTLLALALLALAGLASWLGRAGGTGGERVAVPPVAGLGYEDAARRLEAAGLRVERRDEVTLDSPRGAVVSQEPREGEQIRPGEPVTLVVSRGVQVPSLVGRHWDEVKPWLDQNGWRVGRLRFVFANQQEFGKVVAQDPAPDSTPVADKGNNHINITVAGPPEATKTGFQTAPAAPPPSVRGKPEAPRSPDKPGRRREDD